MKIGIGIDTGGTYTDAVAYDFESGSILGSAKSLTTKEDLTIGILGALDGLPVDLVKKAELVSLSTTLATNACVEDKAVKLNLSFSAGIKKLSPKTAGNTACLRLMIYIYKRVIRIFGVEYNANLTGNFLPVI